MANKTKWVQLDLFPHEKIFEGPKTDLHRTAAIILKLKPNATSKRRNKGVRPTKDDLMDREGAG